MYPFEGSQIDISLKGIYNPYLDLKYISDTMQKKGSLSSFGKLYVNLDRYNPLGPKLCFNTGFSLGLSTDKFIASDYFYVGGHKNNLRRNYIAFVGYNLGEVVATNFLRLKLGLNYRFAKNIQVETLVNGMTVGTSLNDLFESTLAISHENLYIGYGTGITYNSPLGPLSVFFAANNKEPRLRWYVNLGYTF